MHWISTMLTLRLWHAASIALPKRSLVPDGSRCKRPQRQYHDGPETVEIREYQKNSYLPPADAFMYDTVYRLCLLTQAINAMLNAVPDSKANCPPFPKQALTPFTFAAHNQSPSTATPHKSSLPSFRLLQYFLCCSKNKKVVIVCGPNRIKLGTHPLKHHRSPSFR